MITATTSYNLCHVNHTHGAYGSCTPKRIEAQACISYGVYMSSFCILHRCLVAYIVLNLCIYSSPGVLYEPFLYG